MSNLLRLMLQKNKRPNGPVVTDHLKSCQAYLPALLKQYLPDPASSPLAAAMHYACLNGGKRLRPLLVFTTVQLFDVPKETVSPIAAAIEFIHCYSLIHDDLPAMDNDDLRRGKPTCHKVFGEATAMLAGNALLTLAFEIVSNAEHFPHLPASTLLTLLGTLTQASGSSGMIQGQALDLAAQNHTLSLEKLILMHLAKTGALITASVQCGALASGLATSKDLASLHKYGQAIGLCFQIQDDILDTLGDSEIMGKQVGKDAINHKCTFVTLLGVERAREEAQYYHSQALASLEPFGAKADPLRDLAHFILERAR